MKLIGMIILLALSSLAAAQDEATATTMTWDPPTTRVDGTPLDPATELAPYELTCGDKVTEIPSTGDEGQVYEFKKHEILPDYGENVCFLVAVDNDGLKSAPSNEVVIPWDKSAPQAATNLILIVE